MGESTYTIVVPLGADAAAAGELLAVAMALLPLGAGGRVVALETAEARGYLVAGPLVPPPLGTAPAGATSVEATAGRPEVRPSSDAEPSPWQGIVAAADAEGANLIVFDWRDWAAPSRRLFGASLDEVARTVPCDLAAVKRGSLARVRRILLPVRGGPQGLLTLRLATALAEHQDARITVLHIEQPGLQSANDATVRAQLDTLLARGTQPARAEVVIVVAGSVENAILAETELHQVLIMGASPGDPGTPYLFGPVAEAVAQNASCTLVVVKARE